MGESKRRRVAANQGRPWPKDDPHYGPIHLFDLPPHPDIDSTRIRELTGDDSMPPGIAISLRAHRAKIDSHEFLIGFCVGDGHRFSAIGTAVIDRLLREAPDATVHVVAISDREIAWDIVLRHLRTFRGKVLLFAFSDSYVYDGGAAEVFYSEHIVMHDEGGQVRPRLSQAQRRKAMEEAAAMGAAPPVPKFYEMPGVDPQEQPWIFEMGTSGGRRINLTIWNGRHNFIHEMPDDIVRLVGGQRIAIVQVGSPVGVNGRSSITLSRHLSEEFDGIVHWARDTATYRSIIQEFVVANLASIPAPDLSPDWAPDIVLMPVNDSEDERPRETLDQSPGTGFHELREFLLAGYELDRDFWTARTVEEAEKYSVGSHLDIPEDMVHAGEKMFKAGVLRLPNPAVIFEYDTSDQFFERMALLCRQMDVPTDNGLGLILCTPLIRRAGAWSERMTTLLLSFEGEMRIDTDEAVFRESREFCDQLVSMAYCLLLGSVAALARLRGFAPKSTDSGPDRCLQVFDRQG